MRWRASFLLSQYELSWHFLSALDPPVRRLEPMGGVEPRQVAAWRVRGQMHVYVPGVLLRKQPRCIRTVPGLFARLHLFLQNVVEECSAPKDIDPFEIPTSYIEGLLPYGCDLDLEFSVPPGLLASCRPHAFENCVNPSLSGHDRNSCTSRAVQRCPWPCELRAFEMALRWGKHNAEPKPVRFISSSRCNDDQFVTLRHGKITEWCFYEDVNLTLHAPCKRNPGKLWIFLTGLSYAWNLPDRKIYFCENDAGCNTGDYMTVVQCGGDYKTAPASNLQMRFRQHDQECELLGEEIVYRLWVLANQPWSIDKVGYWGPISNRVRECMSSIAMRHPEIFDINFRPEPVWHITKYRYLISTWGGGDSMCYTDRSYWLKHSRRLLFYQWTGYPQFLDKPKPSNPEWKFQRQWHDRYMKPWVHFVPWRGDCKDLLSKMLWVRNHTAEADVIKENLWRLATTHLRPRDIKRFWLYQFNWTLRGGCPQPTRQHETLRRHLDRIGQHELCPDAEAWLGRSTFFDV
eukprot:CAMPEP_0117605120 /NCGR_PEP_ID=MMETSP0784-20121206/79033_1 /TAXON_ID=39447 /ORGANISM="" /LENGTH=515 /DNA_ID=CAMNT_0005408161 /DNA_START=189 /DNA_END=1736 /DNA_ORIENTATION=+